MTLKKYLQLLNKFVKENPDALQLQVLASTDDEGNHYVPVKFFPSKGNYDGYTYWPISKESKSLGIERNANAVCIN